MWGRLVNLQSRDCQSALSASRASARIANRRAGLQPAPHFWVLCFLAVLPALATQQPPVDLKALTLEQLSSIEVTTPSKQPQSAMRAPVAIFVITGEDIRRSGATSIPEALRGAPGVEVARIDSNKWSIGIRGFGSRLSRSVLVVMDGRTVYTPLFAGTYWEVQDTFMDDIDRIEVIRGPGGTIWGPNAVDGVINIITKSTKDTHGLRANASGGTEEQGAADVRYGGGHGNLNYRFYGKGFDRGPEDHPDHQNFDDWKAAQGGFRMDWARTPRDTFTLQGDIYDENAGERVSASSYAAPYSQNINANAFLSGGNILGRWERSKSDQGDITVQIYYDRTNRHEANFADINNTWDIDYLQRVRAPGRQQITWGLGARANLENTPIVVSGLQFLPLKRTDWLVTAFIQDEIGLVKDRLSLTVGSKLLRTNFTGVQFEPSARLAWTPNDRNTLWAAYTHAVRTPSDAEENFSLLGYLGQAAPGLQAFARFNPNPNFAPEQSNGYEVGYRRLLSEDVYVDFTAFLSHHHDLFSEDISGGYFLETSPAPTHVILPAEFENDIYGSTKGFEIAPEWRPRPYWRLRASYSFLNLHLRTVPGTLEVGTANSLEGSSPKSEVTAQSDFDLSKTLQFDLLYRFISALPGEGVAAYSTGDARLAWRVRPQVEVSLVGQNLLQRSHVEAAGDPATLVGIIRGGYVKLTWTR